MYAVEWTLTSGSRKSKKTAAPPLSQEYRSSMSRTENISWGWGLRNTEDVVLGVCDEPGVPAAGTRLGSGTGTGA